MTHIVPALMLLLQTQATSVELGYRFALPSGFTAFPEGRAQKDMVDCWSEERPLSAEGESNWLTASERAGRLGTAAGWWIAIAVAVTAALVWRKRRQARAA